MERVDNSKYKLKTIIGGAEFEAEGDKDTVMAQYRLFLDALGRHAATGAVEIETRRRPTAPMATEPAADIAGRAPEPSGNSAETGDTLERAFSLDRGTVSLRLLPNGPTRDADALILLLFGYKCLKNEPEVYGTQLMKAARQSGLPVERIDRVISHHRDLYLRGGARRGARYALNNQGEAKAKSLLNSLFRS